MRAKLFRNGRSEAVHLPAAFRFEGSEVEIARDPRMGAVMLTRCAPLPGPGRGARRVAGGAGRWLCVRGLV
jgi:hypothetical protein